MKKTQFKTDIHQIFLLTKRNFSDWDKNPRIWMTFALGFVLCLMLTNQILEQAQTFQTPVQMFEPLIWTFGDAQSVMLSSLLLLLLFADMPFVNQMTPYWLIRTKRSVWMASQILYVILSTCLYTVFLCLTELLIASPWAYVGNVWSQTAASIGYGSNNHLTVPVSIKTMEMTTPYKCTDGKSRRRCWRTLDKSLWNSSDSGYFSKSFSSGWRAFLSGKYSLRMVITLKSRNISNA